MKEKLLKNMGWIIVILDVAIYFILSYVFVKGFQQNLLTVFVNGALLFVGAMVATVSMMKQGLLNGGENAKYKETLEAHLKQKQKIYPKLSTLQAWLDKDYEKLLKVGRSMYINSAGYDYEEVFFDSGKLNTNFKVDKPAAMQFTKHPKLWAPLKVIAKFFRWMFGEDWKVYRAKKRFIRKAKHYKITRLTVSDLMNVDADKDPNNFGITEKQYSARETTSSAISRLIFSMFLPSIAFGFFGFNLETLIIQILNMVLILMTALFSMFSAYSFKVKTHRNTIIKKTNKIEEFDNSGFTLETIEKEKEIEHERICSEEPIHSETNMVEENRQTV